MKLFALIAGAFASKDLFEQWKETHSVKYASPKEETLRFDQWMKNKDFVDGHNMKHAAGEKTYTVGMNKFADLSSEEFAEKYLSKVHDLKVKFDLSVKFVFSTHNFDCWPKLQLSDKISIFDFEFRFLMKISIFDFEFRFLMKISIFGQNFEF